MTSNSRTTARAEGRRRGPGAGLLAAVLLGAVLSAAAPGVAREWPAPVGHLSDFAGVVDAASADSIESLARELREKTGAELAVATFSDLGGEEIEEATTDLFARWGVGRKGENDGVLILLAVAERRVRIEVGYGLEGALPDGRCGGIIRRVMGPDLSADRFGPGLLRGARAIANAIAAERGVALPGAAGVEPPADGGESLTAVAAFGLILLIVVLVFVAILHDHAVRRGRAWHGWPGRRGGGFGDPWGGFGGFGGMGGFGSGRGGGGFGGFGGGMSGGGGASGRF